MFRLGTTGVALPPPNRNAALLKGRALEAMGAKDENSQSHNWTGWSLDVMLTFAQVGVFSNGLVI